MMKISLIQPNFQTGPKHLNSFYLPYSLGVLWAYVNQFTEVTENFTLYQWMFRREKLDDAVERLKNSDIALLSMYIWNREYCFTLARRLKEINPNMCIVIGGPEIPHKQQDFFEVHPYINSMVIGEGEKSFHTILKDYLASNPIKKRYTSSRLTELDTPSPYLTGVFDSLIEEYPDIEWVPTLECDRGCPYKCTFCDWGSLTASKMYKIYESRIKEELEWFGKNNLPYLSMTNSNFGIFKERDLLIAQWIVESKKKYGTPSGVSVSYAKNSNDTVIEIVRKFTEANIQAGMSISLQTTNTEVLENIKRTNLKINKISEIVDMCKEHSLPVMTELILGLPGETYESWLESINEIFTNKILYVDIFFLQILVNAPISDMDTEKFKIGTFSAHDYFYETSNNRLQQELEEKTAESIEVVYKTSTLPEERFFNASVFSWFITGMHSYGLTNIISDYIFEENLDSYSGFYQKLLSYLEENEPKMLEWQEELDTGFKDWRSNGFMKTKVGNTEVLGHAILTNLMPVLQNNNFVEVFLDHTTNFLFTEYNLPKATVKDLSTISSLQVKQYGKYIKEPIILELNSDIYSSRVVRVEDRFNDFPSSKEKHLEYLFFGRRRMWHLNKIVPI